MDAERLQQWLQEKQLTTLVDQHYKPFIRVLKDCFAFSDEPALVISDTGTSKSFLAPVAAGCYVKALESLGKKPVVALQTPKTYGDQAGSNVVEALSNLSDQSIVIMTVSNILGRIGVLGKSFRTYCRKHNHRFVSATSMGYIPKDKFDVFMAAVDIDYKEMQRVGARLKAALDSANTVRITTEAGTDITFDVTGMEAKENTGAYHKPGTGGNIPAGEVYMPPKGYTGVNGVFVVDGSMRHANGTELIKDKLVISVENGRVTKLEGEKADILEQSLAAAEARAKYPERVRHVCEFGIGINSGAQIIGSTIIDEKTQNTCHIAIGSNYWFGGDIRTIIHFDQVIKNPTFYLDGKELSS